MKMCTVITFFVFVVLFLTEPSKCITEEEILSVKGKIKEMFYHGFNNYMEHAFPMDELKPISCSGINSYGDYSLTIIDSLDTIYIMGNKTLFVQSVHKLLGTKKILNEETGESVIIQEHEGLDFNKNISVSVFETNIRILGGLLSTYLVFDRMKEKDFDASTNQEFTELRQKDFELEEIDYLANKIFAKAVAVGDILLEAFETKTGLPYGAINLKYGVAKNESNVTCTAACGTYLIEFGVLSALTKDLRYIQAARKAAFKLFEFREQFNGLIGNHINIKSGEWTIKTFSVGAGIDSYFEYLLKAYLLFGNFEYFSLFQYFNERVNEYIIKEPGWYIETAMSAPYLPVWVVHNSLASFYPGVQTQAGDLSMAKTTVNLMFETIWKKIGVIPEGFNLLHQIPQMNQLGYPLRPELGESIYYLYRKTKDPKYLEMGREMINSLNKITRVKCGFANIIDVRTYTKEDKMESFFLAETLKYLYLLFDESNFVNQEDYIFNTEGHIIPKSKKFWKNHLDITPKWIERKKDFSSISLRDLSCDFDINYGFAATLSTCQL